MIYTMSEVAKQLDVAASTLRYYDKEGLLPFIERSVGCMRMFKNEDLSWLKTIKCIKKTGTCAIHNHNNIQLENIPKGMFIIVITFQSPSS